MGWDGHGHGHGLNPHVRRGEVMYLSTNRDDTTRAMVAVFFLSFFSCWLTPQYLWVLPPHRTRRHHATPSARSPPSLSPTLFFSIPLPHPWIPHSIPHFFHGFFNHSQSSFFFFLPQLPQLPPPLPPPLITSTSFILVLFLPPPPLPSDHKVNVCIVIGCNYSCCCHWKLRLAGQRTVIIRETS